MESWIDDFEKRPLWTLFKLFAALGLIAFILGMIGHGLGWFDSAAQVVSKEFSPETMLKKYEWFKTASAELDKKQADIKVYEGRVDEMKQTYHDLPRQNWPREDREQMSTWMSEVAGVKASYNGLAAEYNAQMAKFNWRFANAGDLPKGADKVLPREYKSYEVQ